MADADPQISERPSTVREPGEPAIAPQIEIEAEAPARRRWGRLALMAAVPLAILIGALLYWHGLQGKVATDDAYVKQDKVSVTAEIGGKVKQVFVKTGQMVNAGDLLFKIDPEPFRIQLDQASASRNCGKRASPPRRITTPRNTRSSRGVNPCGSPRQTRRRRKPSSPTGLRCLVCF